MRLAEVHAAMTSPEAAPRTAAQMLRDAIAEANRNYEVGIGFHDLHELADRIEAEAAAGTALDAALVEQAIRNCRVRASQWDTLQPEIQAGWFMREYDRLAGVES